MSNSVTYVNCFLIIVIYNTNSILFFSDPIDSCQFVVNQKGEFIVKPEYDYISFSFFKDGMLLVAIENGSEIDRLYGFVDINGNKIVPPKYTEANDFSDGMAYVLISRKNGKVTTGYLNKKGS